MKNGLNDEEIRVATSKVAVEAKNKVNIFIYLKS